MQTKLRSTLATCLCLTLASLACSDDAPGTETTSTETGGDGDGDMTTTGDGDGDPATGDGDGDMTGDGDGDMTGDGDGDMTGDGDGDMTGDGDGDMTGDGDGDMTGDGDGDMTGDGDGDGDGDPGAVCGDAVVEDGEVCDDGVNDGSYGGCAEDCSAFAAFCGDGEVNGPEACDDANDDITDGCLSCEVPTNCLDILGLDDAAPDGIYAIDPDGEGDLPAFDVTCDMTTDGGGWTRCATIDETGLGNDVCVTESDAFVDAADLLNASFCQLMFEAQTTTAMLVHNRTPDGNSDYGFDDKIRITWDDSPMPFGVYADNHPIQDCRNLTTDTVWADCQYSSHGGNPWQTAAWSFTHGTLDNGYSGNTDRRVTLGPTFQAGTQGCTWHNFGADSNPENLANTWRATENAGDLYLR